MTIAVNPFLFFFFFFFFFLLFVCLFVCLFFSGGTTGSLSIKKKQNTPQNNGRPQALPVVRKLPRLQNRYFFPPNIAEGCENHLKRELSRQEVPAENRRFLSRAEHARRPCDGKHF